MVDLTDPEYVDEVDGRLLVRSFVGVPVRLGEICNLHGEAQAGGAPGAVLLQVACENEIVYRGIVRLGGPHDSVLEIDDQPSSVDGTPLFRCGLMDAVMEDEGRRVDFEVLAARPPETATLPLSRMAAS